MSEKEAVSAAFIAEAAAVLSETESKLKQLVSATWPDFDQSDQENSRSAGDDEALNRLPQTARRLLKLANRASLLQTYLQNGFDMVLPAETEWSKVRILQSHEEERAKLAHDLEDGVGQLLANAVFELASCRHLLSSGHDVTVGLESLQNELEQGLTDIRHVITDLEPATILGSFGLGGGIRRYLEQYEAKTGLKTQLRINTNLGRLPSIVEIAIFRVIQEILSNVDCHANATQVDVLVEENGRGIQFNVIDNGDGLISEKIGASRKNLGLARMVDYAELVNGDLRVLSEPGRGTQVILSVPYSVL